MSRQKIWLGLGGNLGSPKKTIADALELLGKTNGIQVRKTSSLYATPPWGKLNQPDFINAAVEIDSALEPENTLDICLEAEKRLGRKRNEKWGPRIIDIDILAMESGPFESERLTVPHPLMTERAFVLVPLEEIAPELIVKGKPISQWRSECDDHGIRRLEDSSP